MSKKILLIMVLVMGLLAFASPAFAWDNFTPGYWKNHTDAWVDHQPGDDFFASGLSWLEVLNTPPRGNAYFILAHAYIAAELNCCLNGDDDLDDIRHGDDGCVEFFEGRDPDDLQECPFTRDHLIWMAEELDLYNNNEMFDD